MPTHQPRIGRRFTRLVVRSKVPSPVHTNPSYICECDCGGRTEVPWSTLTRGWKKSCGCLFAERRAVRFGAEERNHSIPVRPHPLGATYRSMLQRCYDPKHHTYQWYGARGIAVCPAWQQDFANFVRDLGPRPTPKHTLDRIDPDGNYEPGNCRWADGKTQANNRRACTHITLRGVTHSLYDWLGTLGERKPMTVAYTSLAKYMSPDEALITAWFACNGAGPESATRARTWLAAP